MITDPEGIIAIDPADYPLLSPEAIAQALTDLRTRPWPTQGIPAPERDGYTRAVTCSSGRTRGSYRATAFRALERSRTSRTGYTYRRFDAPPNLSGKCDSIDQVRRAIEDQNQRNLDRATQWVALVNDIGRRWPVVSGQSGGIEGLVREAQEAATPARQYQKGNVQRAVEMFERRQGRNADDPRAQRWQRRLTDSDFRAKLGADLVVKLASDAGVSPDELPADVVEQAAAAVDAAAVAQLDAVASGGLAPELEKLLLTVYPLPSPERLAEVWPLTPPEVQNISIHNSYRFEAAGLK